MSIAAVHAQNKFIGSGADTGCGLAVSKFESEQAVGIVSAVVNTGSAERPLRRVAGH
jgi:hypothetical protein